MNKTTRRHFIKTSIAVGSGLGFALRSTSLFAEKSVKSLRILILGGTGFTGPCQVRYALSRGHKVTTFNRGKTHPGELPNEVEQLVGDRNGKLDALKDRQWDVAIDNPTTLPAWVLFFSSRRRHTRFDCDWSSDVCSSDLPVLRGIENGLYQSSYVPIFAD